MGCTELCWAATANDRVDNGDVLIGTTGLTQMTGMTQVTVTTGVAGASE